MGHALVGAFACANEPRGAAYAGSLDISIEEPSIPIELWNLTFAALGFVAAVVAGWYAVRAYRLKAGISIRGSYGTTETVDCEDIFVSAVTLENMKDRAVVVFEIILELGPGYYLKLESFDTSPLIIEPFQVVHRTYKPIQHYSTGRAPADLNPLLRVRDLRGRLVLSTNLGKYRVKNWLRRWDPAWDYFRNSLTAVFYPVRFTVDGKEYGSNIAYLVRVQLGNGQEQVVPLRESDYTVKLFRNFRLTQESLASAKALEAFLLERALAGDIKCNDITVEDIRVSRAEAFADTPIARLTVPARSWFTYHVIGRLYTWRRDLQLRRENKRNLAALEARAPKPGGPPPPTTGKS